MDSNTAPANYSRRGPEGCSSSELPDLNEPALWSAIVDAIL